MLDHDTTDDSLGITGSDPINSAYLSTSPSTGGAAASERRIAKNCFTCMMGIVSIDSDGLYCIMDGDTVGYAIVCDCWIPDMSLEEARKIIMDREGMTSEELDIATENLIKRKSPESEGIE